MAFTINNPVYNGVYNGAVDYNTDNIGWDGSGTSYSFTINSGTLTLNVVGEMDTFTEADANFNWLLLSGTTYESDVFPNAIGTYSIKFIHDTTTNPKMFKVVWYPNGNLSDEKISYAFLGPMPTMIILADTNSGVYSGSVTGGPLAGPITLTVRSDSATISQPGFTPLTVESEDMSWMIGIALPGNVTKTFISTYRGHNLFLQYNDQINPHQFVIWFTEVGQPPPPSAFAIMSYSGPVTPTPPPSVIPTPVPSPSNPTIPERAGTSSISIWIIIILAIVVIVVIAAIGGVLFWSLRRSSVKMTPVLVS